MVIGRYYEKQHLYGAAIGRYQDIVTNYQTTTYTAEALERIVEVDLNLGLPDAAPERTASVLGYNYPGSTWYQTAYNTLKAHNLVAPAPSADTSGAATGTLPADTGAVAPPADMEQAAPAPRKHHWYWPF